MAENKPEHPKRAMQYLGSVAACLGGFALGTVIGWASPANSDLKELHQYSSIQVTWVISVMTLGGAASAICMIFLARKFGNKSIMIFTIIPFVIGWGLLFIKVFPVSVVARIVLGYCGGNFCTSAPVFVGEISEPKIRGALTTLFQLMITLGILAAYCLGIPSNFYVLTCPLTVVPIFVAILLVFMHDTPTQLLKKDKEEAALAALKFYRGRDFPIDEEFNDTKEYIKKAKENESKNTWQELRKKHVTKAFLLLLLLHVVQQLSGINVIIFYTQPIFEMADFVVKPWTSSVILGVVQVIATLISALVIDKIGRKILFIISLTLMAVCLIVVGVFFYLHDTNDKSATKIAFIPLVAICLYIVGYSLGAGPLPWTLLGELIPENVNWIIGPICVFINWVLAFGVTVSFDFLVDLLKVYTVFWIYAGACVLGVVIVAIFLLETKNLTLHEIQQKLGAP